jgi:hypothetical protein
MVKPHNLLRLICVAGLATLAHAAIWPEQFGPGKRAMAHPPALTDQKLWSEYGLQESETGEYFIGTEQFAATAYRLQDPTAALAAFYWQRPKNAVVSPVEKLSGETANELIVAHGNYVLLFQGYKPRVADLIGLYAHLPKLDQSPLPGLIGFQPTAGLLPNSERYVTGPAGLEMFFPGIQPGLAAFSLGAEGHIGTFRSGNGEMKLAIFSYPTPNMARERLAEMQKLPEAMAKRTGPLVAIILSPANADDAERLLSQVRYQASISWSQYVPSRRDNIGNLVVNAFILIGVLLAFSTVAGLAFGGLRVLMKRGRIEDPEAMTVLDLRER